MTLLSLINDVQDKLSLPRSTVVISSTDDNVRNLLACANEEGRALAKRHSWQELEKEHTFTSVATAAQTNGLASDLGNPKRFIVGTFFNRTRNRRLTGPLSPEEWQAQQALSATLLTDAFRLRGDTFLITPTPPAGDTYAYEYVSNLWVDGDGDGDGDTDSWAADDDTSLLSEDLMFLGIIWRFRKSKGLDYAEDFNEYEREVTQAMMRSGTRRVISWSTDESLYDHARPPLVVDGGWNL